MTVRHLCKFVLSILFFTLIFQTTFAEKPFRPDFRKYPALKAVYSAHKLDQFPASIQKDFFDRYKLVQQRKYIPNYRTTFCTLYFYDYFTLKGYGSLLEEMKQAYGKTMVEKSLNYANNKGKIKVLFSGYEAQKYANNGREVGVIGEYYYDKYERYFTRHYSVVQPSKAAYNANGSPGSYYVTAMAAGDQRANNRYGSGVFLAQAGVANGFIDFKWAYNSKTPGLIQRDSKGKIRGGIIFVLFPDKNGSSSLKETPVKAEVVEVPEIVIGEAISRPYPGD